MTIRIRRTGLLSDAIGIVRMADWSIVRNKRRWMHYKDGQKTFCPIGSFERGYG